MYDHNAFPREIWELFLPSSLTALRGKNRLICVGTTVRRMLTAGDTRQSRPKLDDVNLSEGYFGVVGYRGQWSTCDCGAIIG